MKLKDLIFSIEPFSFREVLEYLTVRAKNKHQKTFVVTINPEIAMIARKDKDYEKVIKSADLALADGIGVVWAGKMFGKSFKGRVHGSDLVEKLSEAASKQPITVGFLGGKENVAERAAKCLQEKYSGLKVAFATEEVSKVPQVSGVPRGERSKTPLDTRDTLGTRATLPPCDILFVAFGFPKQEIWIYENLPNIDVRVAIGVGGAFDFVSGRIRRAPVWVRNIGFEWLFRLIVQPWRIKRQSALIHFVLVVLKEKLGV